jgi:hypothetical protein
MSYYSRNLLEEYWDRNSAEEHAERVAKAEQEAGFLFALSTKDQQAEYDATMRGLLGMVGPKWQRAREAAKAKFYADTQAARDLCDRTVECLLETGEVSEALSDEWDALSTPAGFITVGDHAPERRVA